MQPSGEVVLRMEKVSKVYEGDPPFKALDNISLEIRAGEVISIIGPSGSGKSTLLHLLGCLDKPTTGEIYVGGKAVSKMSDDELAYLRRDSIGFVFQAFNLAPTLNVFQNVELPLLIRGLGKEERKKIVDRHLAVVGLTDKALNMSQNISGGQKQRVAVARSLVNSPKILLADEPTGNLDSKSSDEVIRFIMSLCKERGITVIFVTHDPRIAAQTERQINIMDGRIESDKVFRSVSPQHGDRKGRQAADGAISAHFGNRSAHPSFGPIHTDNVIHRKKSIGRE